MGASASREPPEDSPLPVQEEIGPAWNTGMLVGSARTAFALKEGRLRYEVSVTDEDASSFLVRPDW